MAKSKKEPERPSEKYLRVVLIKSKARKAMDQFKYDMLEGKSWLYEVKREDGMVTLSPRDTPASYLLATVPEDCVKPWKAQRVKKGNDSSGTIDVVQ